MAEFDMLDPELITVDRETRQRRELTNIEELAESIRNVGLINPIVIDENFNLIAGERRLTACLLLGLNPVPVRYLSSLTLIERHLIELEENVKRVDLSWQDHVRAVEEYHKLKLSQAPEYTQSDLARDIGMSPANVGKYLLVANNMQNPLVKEADKLSTAYNAASRSVERKAAVATREVANEVDKILGLSEPQETTPAGGLPARIDLADFNKFGKTYSGPKFNFIHCDFPYGVGIGDKSGQSAARVTGHYEDTPEVYFQLLDSLASFMPHVSEQAHLIFWFSMDYYAKTFILLKEMGWRVNPFPLIWHKSDNSGILPDPNRGPRRTYETAFFASIGDRKVVKAVANSFSGPTTRELHTSEKPRPMLEHFFRMVVDDSTVMLDPTCGSGNSVRVSASLGAMWSQGLEVNPEFAEGAKLNLEKQR